MLFKYLNINHLKPLNKSYSSIKLILYTKKNCSLCDEAKEIIEETYSSKFLIEDVDITKDRDLFRKFKLDIPVFYYNGEFLMKHRVDHEALKNLIKKIESAK
jgi:hypothetical protein